jgi:hypothetical protein
MNLWCQACRDVHHYTSREAELIVYDLLIFTTSGDMTQEPACLNEVRTNAMANGTALAWRAARLENGP